MRKLYYPCSENKGTNQRCKADLCLCFRIGKNPVFLWRCSIVVIHDVDIFTKIESMHRKTYNLGFRTGPTNLPAQLQKARSLKFWIQEKGEIVLSIVYNMHLCFCICRLLVF